MPGGSPASHEIWKLSLKAAAAQKTFKVLDPEGRDGQVREVDITLLADASEGGESSAEQTGWVVDVRYSNAPDVVLFTNTFPTEDLAKKVMDDLSNAAAEVEGKIRQADFEGAAESMTALNNLFKSSSAEPPVADAPGAQS